MSLARAWTRQLFGASGVALLAPGTLVVALALLGLAGGFGRLGSLGQAFGGPAVPTGARLAGPIRHAPPVTPLVPAGARSAAARGPRPIASTGTATGGGTGSAPGAGSGGGGGTQTGQGSGSGGGGAGGSRGNGGGSGSHHGGGGGGPATGPPATAPPPVAHPPTVVDGVVNAGTSITQKVPGPVGTAATQLLQNLGKTVDGLLPSSGRSPATGASPTPSSASTAPAQ